MTVVNAPPYTLQACYKPGQHLICNTQQLLRGQRKAHGLAWYSETAELVTTPLFPQTRSEVYLGNSSLARTNRRERGRILCIIHRFFGNKIFILTFTSKRRCSVNRQIGSLAVQMGMSCDPRSAARYILKPTFADL